MIIDPPADLTRHRRVVVYGVTGSGKSVLAARLAGLAGSTYVAVDDLMWRPGWVQLSAQEQVEAIAPVAAGDAWVMDALWSATRPVVLPRTDLVVALDFRRSVSFGRLLRRTASRLVTRAPICGGNTESWRQAVSSDSILAWHVRSFASKRSTIAAWCADPDGPAVVRFTSPRQVEAWASARRAHAAS